MFAVLIFMRSFGVRNSDQVLVDSLSKTFSKKNQFGAGNYGHAAAAGMVGEVTLGRLTSGIILMYPCQAISGFA